jgi:hypothetical protein
VKRTTHRTNREQKQKGPYAPEMVEPPEAMANAAVLLAQQDSDGIKHHSALGRAD